MATAGGEAVAGVLYVLRYIVARSTTDPRRAGLLHGVAGMTVLATCTGGVAIYSAITGHWVPAVLAGLAAVVSVYSAVVATLDLRGRYVSRWYLRFPTQRPPRE